VRLHVPAKRYLCAVDPGYRAGLSDGSKTSLIKQGGPMSEAKAKEFSALPGCDAAVRLRRIDDQAKVAGLAIGPIEDFADHLVKTLKT
jgi:gamma-butyrobetaine dioxygenase